MKKVFLKSFMWLWMEGFAWALGMGTLTMDAWAPTASFLQASQLAGTAPLLELGRVPGRLLSQVKALGGALAVTLHSSGVTGGGTAQKPKCQEYS